jgi:uncharacterized protein
MNDPRPDAGQVAPRDARPRERLDSLDALRGFAVLGILLMNIIGFGLPNAYENPAVAGGIEGANLAAWLTTSLLFEGTMRGLFTLLFGAGVVLFLRNAEARDPASAADLHVRRMLWLIVFGFVNSHLLLFAGDILFEYGCVGLVLYAFRNARPRTLIVIAILLYAVLTLRGTVEYLGLTETRANGEAAAAIERSGLELSPEQAEALEAWRDTAADLSPAPEKLQEDVDAMRGGYGSALGFVSEHAQYARTTFFYEYGFLEDLATMLLGVALFGLGALQGRWTARQYAALAVLGYGIGLTVNALEAWHTLRSGFDPVDTLGPWLVTYELGRVPLTLGHAALLLLLWKSGVISSALARVAATGRMAFTNYLTQSLICMLLFTGVGLGLYGQLERHQLYYVVAGIWVLQLAWSPWWLARFHQGPLEWLWRRLVYRAPQPFRRARPA